MANSVILKLACAILVFIAVAAPLSEAAITCGDVTSNLAPCLRFLETGLGQSPGCCSGVRELKIRATTTDDRRTACRCMKSAAAAFPDISAENSAALPGKCGVRLDVSAGAQTDCSKIN